ncbi:cytosine deaminase [Labrys okinawensis]|uniref:cytosine deaminase n=1 Tax=Labrys okinawensis TaxID=346911 RepID=UPI0039BD326B
MARERPEAGKLIVPSLPEIPASGRWSLEATVPACLVALPGLTPDEDGLARISLTVENGKIVALTPAGGLPGALRAGMAFPTFVELHTHLDKGHIWPRRRNPDGTFFGALDNVTLDREAHWSAADVAARMEFSLRCAYAHGTSAIRTHLDSIGKQIGISWPVFAEMREKWAGRIELQAVALFSIEQVSDRAHVSQVTAAVRDHDGIMGGVTYMVPELDQNLDTLFRLAADNGLDLDFHVDETQDPASRSLRHIAEAALRHRFAGQVTVGHCCSLARQEEEEIRGTVDKMAASGIAVVSLPMCNLYLQDRVTGRTPRSRGVTLLHELKAAGVKVAVASDNTRDPFYAYGDLDALEVFREASRIAHFDHPFGDWPMVVTATPASVMGIDAGRLRVGGAADFVLFRARNWTELLSRPQSDRVVVRGGQAIDTALPDYEELDGVLAG